MAQSPTAEDFKAWGLETVATIRRDYAMPGSELYADIIQDGIPSKQPAFNWGVGVMIPALSAAANADRAYRKPLAEFIESTRSYWNEQGPVPGYSVLPHQTKADRYYDDNEWMVMGLAEAAGRLRSSKVLGYAKQTFEYVRSGLDDKLGGGIYWRESEKTSKNTCSNGPGAAAALALYEQTKDPGYLDFARNVYAWTRAHLRDKADGLYYDSISLSGKVSPAKWSYNSALMLRSAVDLYRFTHEESYATDAQELQDSSLHHWIGPNGAFKDDAQFGFLLMEAWQRAYRYVPKTADPTSAIRSALEFVHAQCRDSKGYYGGHWNQPAPAAGYSKSELIHQAATARAFLYFSLAQGDHR